MWHIKFHAITATKGAGSVTGVRHFPPCLTNVRTKQKSTHWKLNASLLYLPNTMEVLEREWLEWEMFREHDENQIEWYLEGKKRMRERLQIIGKREAAKRRTKDRELHRQLQEELKKGTKNITKIYQLKKEIDTLDEYAIEGMKIRARTLTMPQEERGSRDFYHITNKNERTNSLNEIQREDGKITSDPKEIKTEVYNFYKQLYTSQGCDEESADMLIGQWETPLKLTEAEKAELNRPITIRELQKVLSKMNTKRRDQTALP